MRDIVLIFDGDCSFCTSTANVMTKNTRGQVVAHAWQLVDLEQFGLSAEDTAKRVYLLKAGKKYSGAKAVAQLLQQQKNLLLRILGVVLVIPPFSWLAIPGYALVARFRHKLPGGTPACKL